MPKFSAKINFTFSSNVTKVGNQIAKTFKKIRSAAKQMASAVKDNTEGFAALSSIIKRGMLVGLAALTVAFGIATASALKYDKSLRELSAITGITGKQLEDFGDIALQSSVNFGVAASEYLNAVKLVASAKPELLEQPKLLRAITDEAAILAKASGIDLATATNALTASMNQFGLGADEASRAINVLAAGSKRGASEVADTAEALIKSGVAAKLAGESFEQTNAAIQILASRSIKGARAGTTLQATYVKMAGIISKSGGAVKDVAGLLDLLAPKMKDVNFLTEQFGLENVKAIQILIENRKQLNKMTESITGTGIAYDQAKINMASFTETTKRLKQGLVVALMLGFRPFIKVLQILGRGAVKALRILIKYPRVITAMIVALGITVALFGALAAEIAIFTGIATGATGALWAATTATWAFNAALIANPIGLIVAGVVLLIATVAILAAKWDSLSGVMKGFLLTSGIGVMVAIAVLILKHWTKIETFFRAFVGGVLKEMKPVIDELKEAFMELSEPFAEIFDAIGTLFDAITGGGDESRLTLLKIATAAAFAAKAMAVAIKIATLPLRVLIGSLRVVLRLIKMVGEGIKKFTPDAAINKFASLFTEDQKPLEGRIAAQRAANSAARAEALKISQSQSLDVRMKIDSQGRPVIEKAESSGNLNFTAQTGQMVPGGG
jgi:TP901 family phage tail tape measure protein